MNRVRNIIFFVLLALTSCINRSRGKAIIESNKEQDLIIQERMINDIKISVQYMPAELKLLKHQQSGSVISHQDSVDILSFSDFKVIIQKKFWKPEKATIEYMSFKIGSDFVLIDSNNDTIKTSICERMVNGSSDTHELLMSFETGAAYDARQEGFKLVYLDKLLGTGALYFNIPGSAIKNLQDIN
jgi:hypothetical protein